MENFSREERKKDTYHVLTAEYVSDEDGTGIVHIAPAYGEVDYDLLWHTKWTLWTFWMNKVTMWNQLKNG